MMKTPTFTDECLLLMNLSPLLPNSLHSGNRNTDEKGDRRQSGVQLRAIVRRFGGLAPGLVQIDESARGDGQLAAQRRDGGEIALRVQQYRLSLLVPPLREQRRAEQALR